MENDEIKFYLGDTVYCESNMYFEIPKRTPLIVVDYDSEKNTLLCITTTQLHAIRVLTDIQDFTSMPIVKMRKMAYGFNFLQVSKT